MHNGLSSMTGYGRASSYLHGWQIRVECRSVNHRGLDVRVRVPGELRWMEKQIISRAKEHLKRGRLEVRVDLEPGADEQEPTFEQIDEHRFATVAQKLKELARKNDLATGVTMGEVLEYRPFFERSTGEVFSEERGDELIGIYQQALDRLVESRQTEGQGIAEDFQGYLKGLTKNLKEVMRLREVDQQSLRSRVEDRLRQALKEFDVGEVDETRVAQELAFFVEKGDIAEELQRADSHLQRLSEMITTAGDEAVGKKIDFYLQELVRETNTMGSKSQHAGLTGCVIEMKSIVEKMREQAANIE